MKLEPLKSLPTRRLLPLDVIPETDRYGFLSFFQTAEGFDAFFDTQFVLVVAPPWMGKTFVSNQLMQHFERFPTPQDAAPFGKFIHRTDFEKTTDDIVLPSWWNDWLRSQERACWIIDAIDEGARDGGEGVKRCLNALECLTADQRRNLCVFAFVRENEYPKYVDNRIQKIYGLPAENDGKGFVTMRLAPLDVESARDHLQDATVFQRVCDVINRNHLQALSGYPSVLFRLAKYSADTHLSDVLVWKDVILDLIHDKRDTLSTSTVRTSLEAQFQAAARLALILTFSDCDAIRETDAYIEGPSIDALIPIDHSASQCLNAAGREVVRCGIFRRTSKGLQFAQQHVQQWLAAFGLASFSLTRLRPLLTDANGRVLAIHKGVMALLQRTSEHQDVKNWIVEKHGGVAPRSDAAPWDLSQSLDALDRLQSIAKTTEWGLSLWNERGLKFLSAPGFGHELAKRLRNKALSRNEIELLLDVGLATGAGEVVAEAFKIALDSFVDERLRDHASTIVIVLGQGNDLEKLLEAFPKGASPMHLSSSVRSGIIQRLLDNEIYDFATAIRELPEYNSRSRTLYYRLQNQMTIEDARTYLASSKIDDLVSELEAERAARRGMSSFAATAIGLIVKQPILCAADYSVLYPLALSQYVPKNNRGSEIMSLADIVAKDDETRRKLLLEVIATSGEGANDISGRIWPLFPEADLDWITDIAIEDAGRHPWLWRVLVQATMWKDASSDVKERVLKKAIAVVPDVVKQVETELARHEEQEREFEEQRRQFDLKAKRETFELSSLIDDTLKAGVPLCDKMRHLSWLCFCDDSFRPSNVIGNWDGLDDVRKNAVISLCEQSLRECPPTPIPPENSYPASLIYEGFCFVRLSQLRPYESIITEDNVRKWLHATLVVSATFDDSFVVACHEAAPKATAQVLMDELHRSLACKPQMAHWAVSLPDALWTDGFSQAAAIAANNSQFELPGRAELVRKLLVHAKSRAFAILNKWLTSSDKNERIAAVDLLIISEPSIIWNEFQTQLADNAQEALLKIGSLAAFHHRVPHGMELWPAAYIEELYEYLVVAFPPHTDPTREDGVSYSYGRDDAFRDLRKSLPPLLLSRGTEEDLAALNRICSKHKEIKNWYDMMRAQRTAGVVLGEVAPVTPSIRDAAAPFGKIAKLLDFSVYRLIRTVEDLQAVLIEELSMIESDAKQHLSCLYYPRKGRRDRSKRQSTLQEDALQAYLYCRLSDRLRGRVLEPNAKIILNREPLSTKDRRVDIKVEAPTLGGQFVAVIVELKWSMHPKVSLCLGAQLGEQYLVEAGLTHGIYLVGWSGSGRWHGRDKRPNSTILSWRGAIAEQASTYNARRSGISISSLVIDLSWDLPEVRKRSKEDAEKRVQTPKRSVAQKKSMRRSNSISGSKSKRVRSSRSRA